MDVSQELLIDVGLNVAGYLTAGFLSILLYSLFTKSAKSVVVSRMTESGQSRLMPSDKGKNQTAEAATNQALEFVDFGNSESVDANEPVETAARPLQVGRNYQRNRLKIISTARKMLYAGTPESKVKSVLPISDAELNLLMIGKG
jgi:hypothetical protein